MASEERIRSAMLVGLTVLALTLGAWWWRSTAPWLGTTGSSTTDDLVRSRVEVEDALGQARSTGREPAVVAVDPETGEVGPGPDRSVVIHIDPDGSARPLEVSHVVWRETSRLAPGAPAVVRQANPSSGDTYRLSVRCSGDGAAVALRVTGAGDTERVLSCGAVLDIPLLEGTGAPVLVRFEPLRGEAELDARLEALY
ncbi:hypothetical protein O7598_01220 [Micromonospora sp. WMMC241]|uniref:hypothetical protein n=1 Tax=Micromonospora sp. WMMC241 TaxID=3015159 RepID=UPI0022B66A99|nr:hypothetical protein [Micromonospora sp. WMMC241]MCZ7435002.1 hypothetical protein [Micromonospora sp. WMMC241]